MFLKNKNIIFKIRRSQVTDYAALKIYGVDTHELPNRGNSNVYLHHICY